MGDNREWLGSWIDRETKDKPLTPAARERALDVAESTFHGTVGVGHAAKAGIEAVEREIYKK